jgi:NitT/TauT family transport system substrate-binding protein
MQFFRRTLTLSFIALAAALVTTSCQSPSANVENSAKNTGLQKITIAQFGHVFLYMPLYVAVRNKYFEHEGLDVTLVSTGGDEKTFTAVSSGNAQFGVADPVFTAVARERGQGGKVVASLWCGVCILGVIVQGQHQTVYNACRVQRI